MKLFFVDRATLAIFIIAEIGQIVINDAGRVFLADSQPKFIVHTIMLVFIEKTCLRVNLSLPERGRLRDEVLAEQFWIAIIFEQEVFESYPFSTGEHKITMIKLNHYYLVYVILEAL